MACRFAEVHRSVAYERCSLIHRFFVPGVTQAYCYTGLLFGTETVFALPVDRNGFARRPVAYIGYVFEEAVACCSGKCICEQWAEWTKARTETEDRIDIQDKPGVLSEITKKFAKHKISVQRLIQIPNNKNKTASIVIITHKSLEKDYQKCIKSFKSNKNIIKNPILLRLF